MQDESDDLVIQVQLSDGTLVDVELANTVRELRPPATRSWWIPAKAS